MMADFMNLVLPLILVAIFILWNIVQHARRITSAKALSTAAHSTETRGHLLSLTAELRLRIYELVVVSERPLEVKWRLSDSKFRLIFNMKKHFFIESPKHPALTCVSRLLRAEVLQVFYTDKIFSLPIDFLERESPTLSKWLHQREKRLDLKFRLQVFLMCGNGYLEVEFMCDRREGATGPVISLGKLSGPP